MARTTRTEAQDPPRTGHAGSTPTAAQRSAFLVDHKLERLLEIRDRDPATFAVFSPQTVTALGAYEAARAAAGYTERLAEEAVQGGDATPAARTGQA